MDEMAIAAEGAEPQLAPSARQLASIFNRCFGASYSVRCVGGFAEPEYRPKRGHAGTAELRYTKDFPASALHEIAHWCIAGRRRLAMVDFGYAYQPPPRTAAQQRRFFALEVKVQTLEAWFALGTGVRFVASADNLDCDQASAERFALMIRQGLALYSESELPPRARAYTRALQTSGLGIWPVTVAEQVDV